jgi:Cu(I)/Ag(I) efflux system membrane fusion protein
MDLVPVKSAEAGSEGPGGLRVFTTTPEAAALMDIETSRVERRVIRGELRMFGKVAYDERRVKDITAWVGGRIDRLLVDFTGTRVREGQPVASLYSPTLIAAQEELLQAVAAERDLSSSTLASIRETAALTVKSAREKLRLLGLSEAQIREVEERGTASDQVTVNAPIAGTVVDKHAQEGMYVKTGMRIFTVADLTRVWVLLDAYESDIQRVRLGDEATFTVEALDGKTFAGSVAFIDPYLDEKTRSVKVRLDAPNPAERLKPGMFVNAVLRYEIGEGEMPPLVIPASAPLMTGTRAVVYVALPGADAPTFEGREIVLGPRAGDYYVVLEGLEEGDLVVTRGNFKIDSALQIEAKPSMMSPEGTGGTGAHVHGAGPETAPSAPETHTDHPAVHAEGAGRGALPAVFVESLAPLSVSFEGIEAALKASDLENGRESFAKLGHVLDSVDPGGLDGHALHMWRELRMLLKNDAVEGGGARDLEDARRVLLGLRGHFERLRETFPAPFHAEHADAPAVTVTSAEFSELWGRAVAEYFAVQGALSKDDFEGAKASAARLLETFAGLEDTSPGEGADDTWADTAERLAQRAGDLGVAGDIEGLRKDFAALSEELIAAVRLVGAGPGGAVYVLRCPMAFSGAGARWLQGDREVKNPYFGAAMFTCGEVTETFGAAGAPEKMEHVHE